MIRFHHVLFRPRGEGLLGPGGRLGIQVGEAPYKEGEPAVATAGVSLEDTVLSEISRSQENKYCETPLT